MNGNAKKKKVNWKLKKRQRATKTMRDNVTSFLWNPVHVGAYCARLVVPHKATTDLWDYLSDEAHKRHKRLKVGKPEKDRKLFDFMREAGHTMFLEESLDGMLNSLLEMKDLCPVEVKKWSDYGNVAIYPEYFLQSESRYEEGFFFFPPQVYFEDIQDAMSINVDNRAQPDFVAEIASLTPKALKEFESFVTSIPCFKKRIVFTDEGKRHSQRLVHNLYLAVAALWVDKVAYNHINRETIDFLSGVIDYIDKREWRISIVLSAISAETILADIYEEIFHKEAPPAPIGTLIREITGRRNFPHEAMKPLSTINKLRKAAVHRGTTGLTRREAMLGLMSSVTFAIWFSFNGKTFFNVDNK